MPYVPSSKTPKKEDDRKILDPAVSVLAKAIAEVCKRHGYDGAFAGELNYSLTRLLQELPRELIAAGQWKEEMRYWFQPCFFGVLQDVALEYKVRVNRAYEDYQIVLSGDCYDAPYYTKAVEVVDVNGVHVGYTHVSTKRSDETKNMNKDILDLKLVLKS